MAALTTVSIFDPLIMQMLNRQCETLRVGANSHSTPGRVIDMNPHSPDAVAILRALSTIER